MLCGECVYNVIDSLIESNRRGFRVVWLIVELFFRAVTRGFATHLMTNILLACSFMFVWFF